MGYYCTVPQCTSLAGKTKNVKFHRFPRDVTMADRWNVILRRGKPYTKYSKVCSLHFTQGDYNVTAMGQWKTLSKDAVPSQNLPKLNPDGSVMVIRKSRTIKYKDGMSKKEAPDCEKYEDKWPQALNSLQMVNFAHSAAAAVHAHLTESMPTQDVSLPFRLQPESSKDADQKKSSKQDAVMQTDPQSEDSNSEVNENNGYNYKGPDYAVPKDYTKDYIPQTNEEYNKEAERYALERKTHDYKANYGKVQEPYFSREYADKDYNRYDSYQTTYIDDAPRPIDGGPERTFFNESQIKQEIDISQDDDKYAYERSKEVLDASMYEQQRLMQQRLIEHVQQQVKTEPGAPIGCDTGLQQSSPYYPVSTQSNVAGEYYQPFSRPPGPELLIAKQNALAAHTQLWQNSIKRPFFYSDTPHYNGSQLLHRYEDLTRIIQ